MFKMFFLFLAVAGTLLANSLLIGMPIDKLQTFQYEDQYEKTVKIPSETKVIILSYEKDTGAVVNAFLKEKDARYLKEYYNALFIADISGMPSIITAMFALPKMRKYAYTIYLTYSDEFVKYFPSQEDKITVLHFDMNNKVSKIIYVSTKEELQKAIAE